MFNKSKKYKSESKNFYLFKEKDNKIEITLKILKLIIKIMIIEKIKL